MKIRSKLRIGIAVCLFLHVAASGQKPRDGNAEVSAAEYEVFSAYLSESFVGAIGKERVGKPVSQIVIVDRTESRKDEIASLESDYKPQGGVGKYLRKEAPRLLANTLSSFNQANAEQAKLALRFHLPLQYQLVSRRDILSMKGIVSFWPDYYERYPGAQGFLTLSRVGFSSDGKQALFYTDNSCGLLCATGSYVVMEKLGTTWKIIKEVVLWVS